jgi:AcrR family transcriptional regulator
LTAFSTRKLAARLGCEAMSIYHYFPSKAHLFDAMIDRCINEMPVAPSGADWIERLRRVGFDYHAMALRHPGFFPFFAVHRLNIRTALAWLDSVLRIFEDGGLDAETRARQFRILAYYVVGACLDETSGYAKGPTAADKVPDAEVERKFPSIVAVGSFFQPQHHLRIFEAGLNVVLEGIRASRKS